MTGAVIPEGADAVVQVELTDGGSSEVRLFAAVDPGANIRHRGDDVRAGATVLGSWESSLQSRQWEALGHAGRP